jgi:phosphoribosylformylglycinamidine cyclo-ligase
VPPVFTTLQRAGDVAETEMFRTFNMGLGYLLIVPPGEGVVLAALASFSGLGVFELGEIVSGERGVELVA